MRDSRWVWEDDDDDDDDANNEVTEDEDAEFEVGDAAVGDIFFFAPSLVGSG